MIRELERGMIFWGEVLKGESRGSEQWHDQATPCPWVIISADIVHRRLPIVSAMPLTSKVEKDQNEYFRHYRIRVPEKLVCRYNLRPGETQLRGESLALTEQTRVLAHERLIGDPIAYLDARMLAALEAGAKAALGFA